MNHYFSILNNEKGAAVVIAVLILAALTLVGISSINTSTTELKIVRNEQIYQTNFYQAESGAHEVAQRIEQEPDPFELIPNETNFDWMNDDDTIDYFVSSNWVNDGSPSDNSDTSLIDPTTSYSALGKGVRAGSSLDIGSTRLYEFSAFGLSQWNNGRAVVEVGYLKRF